MPDPLTSRGTIVSLCDISGNFTRPWTDAGYDAVLVDPQHGMIHQDGATLKLALTVSEAMPYLRDLIAGGRIAFVAGWPPCTDMATSGSRHWESKRTADPDFQAKAAIIAEQCRTFAQLAGAPYLIENPRSWLSRMFGAPSHSFNPSDYSAIEPADNYAKFTCLWTGNGFVMPPRMSDTTLGAPREFVLAARGKDRANLRSVTPMGFAQAVFAANAPADLVVAA